MAPTRAGRGLFIVIGTFYPTISNAFFYEVGEADAKRHNETFKMLRVLLAKAKHYQKQERALNKELKEEYEVLLTG